MNLMLLRLAVVIPLVLVGCVTPPGLLPVVVDGGPKPSPQEAEAVVRQRLARILKDPDSLKQFEIRQVAHTQWYRGLIHGGGAIAGWLVCFEYNAKNSYGGYTGVKLDGVVMQNTGGLHIVPDIDWRNTSAVCY